MCRCLCSNYVHITKETGINYTFRSFILNMTLITRLRIRFKTFEVDSIMSTNQCKCVNVKLNLVVLDIT